MADLDRFRQARRQFAALPFESVYANWLLRGHEVFFESLNLGGDTDPARGRLLTRALRYTYGP